jgi:hypothetical protein
LLSLPNSDGAMFLAVVVKRDISSFVPSCVALD